jgi:hypothetical protein
MVPARFEGNLGEDFFLEKPCIKIYEWCFRELARKCQDGKM